LLMPSGGFLIISETGRGFSCEDTYEPVSARRDHGVRGFVIGALGRGFVRERRNR